jgi:hypothetical protein
MRWEERMLDLFEDLEQVAEGLALAERDAEVAELARAAYAEVGLDDRVHASRGRELRVGLTGAADLSGCLERAGAGWWLLTVAARPVVVRPAAVMFVQGLAPAGVPEPSRPMTARLGIGSVLRRLAEDGDGFRVDLVDGRRVAGRPGRVGADFLELAPESDTGGVAAPTVVPLARVALVRAGLP